MGDPKQAAEVRPALYRIFSQRDMMVIADPHGTIEGATKLAVIAPNAELLVNGDLVDRGPYFDEILKADDRFSPRRTAPPGRDQPRR